MRRNQKGQALISLMFFVIISVFLISAAIVMLIVSASSTGDSEGTENVSRVAEAAADDAILKLLRDPTFAGEILSLPDGTASATVSGGVVTVDATTSSNFHQRLVVTTNLTNNILSVTSWKEGY